jgi:5'-nucleotidase
VSNKRRHGKIEKPYIILSNDDGIKSAGLRAVFNAVSGLAEVLVVAPASEKSGVSRSISIAGPIKLRKTGYHGAEAYAVYGTPADCAKIALMRLARRQPRLFLSGINHGPNLAQFILYSGTVGAAAESALLGTPAMAFSIDNFEPEDFSFAEKYIRTMVMKVLKGGLRVANHTLLNINFPDRNEAGIKGIKIVTGGLRLYEESYKRAGKRSGRDIFMRHVVTGRIKSGAGPTDAESVRRGYVTITPLKFDLTDLDMARKMKKARGWLL